MAAAPAAMSLSVPPSVLAVDKTRARGEAEIEESRWRPVLELPCQLTVDLPLPGIRVADFLNLQVGSVLATRWRLAQDVPLRVNGTLIAWGELEGSGAQLAVRLTDLA